MTAFGRRTDVQTSANTMFGMIVVALSTCLICACGAIAQYDGGSILQLMLGSYILQNLMGWAWWCLRKPSQATHWYGDSPFKCNIWTRGILYWVEMFTWWKGLEMIPIGDAEAILFVSPMLTVFLARVLLKENLPRLFPLILTLTVIGLIFVCQPEFIFQYGQDSSYESVSWAGMLFLLACLIGWSSSSLLVRTAKEAHWLQVNLVSSFQAAWIWTPMFAILNHYIGNNLGDGNGDPETNHDASKVAWIDGSDFADWDWSPATCLTMLAMAFFEFFGVMGKVVGYQLGEATKVAVMEYLDIVFAFGFQWFLFRRAPNKWEYIGSALLVMSCLIQFLEEKFWPREPTNNNDNNPASAELETLLPGEEETNMFKKYGTGNGNSDSRWITIGEKNTTNELVESSPQNINAQDRSLSTGYDVDAYKDITKDWPRGEDRSTSY